MLTFILVSAFLIFLAARGMVYWTHFSDAREGILSLKDKQSAEWLYAIYLENERPQLYLILNLKLWTFEDFFPGLAKHLK